MSSQLHQIMDEQDEKIDEIGKAVKRIKPMAGLIGQEIDKQKIIIDEMGNKMDTSEEKMGKAMTKLSQLLQTTDRGYMKTFMTLLCIAIVLFLFLMLG
mmetsp:Transcript_26404/g.27450  ORF Transcript_26404/g.27450 Transcript_26404/m.27450 type:complete len:98 (-) Transcript_26404:52-345(-)